MSFGLESYDSTIAGYGSSANAIKNFTDTYDTDFFRNWTEKHNLFQEKLKEASDTASGIGGSVLAGQLGLKAFRARAKAKADNEPEEQPEEPTEESPIEEPTEAPVEELGDVADVADAAPTASTLGATPNAVQGAADDEEVVEGFGADAEEPVAEAAQTFARPTTSGYEAPETDDAAPPTQELSDLGGDSSESTTAVGTESTVITGEATEGTVAAAGETASTLSAVGDAALAVGATALDVIPVLGLLAGVGIGLYELFHHKKAPPAAPNQVTVSSRGEMVLPSYDSVTDTPASSSAF
tara:strand:- start:232 stop:1122 length:891 start_codon:yes stop_codon:yes gene_type:complete